MDSLQTKINERESSSGDYRFSRASRARAKKSPAAAAAPRKALVLFGTRPEVIKLAPVVHELEKRKDVFRTIVVSSGQHADLIEPFLELFKINLQHDLKAMRRNQTPNQVCARVLTAFDKILNEEKPDLVLVQGDTTTALAGALAAFHRRIPVGHVEAGLRSGDPQSPFPEETNRHLISGLATFHFAATRFNRETLINEGVNPQKIFVTGNPVVDALHFVGKTKSKKSEISKLLRRTKNLKRILLTTHRRESFGVAMRENLRVLRDFVEKREDMALVFPVHPNPAVQKSVQSVFNPHPRVFLLEPLAYNDFVRLMANSWLVVSDSGGVQEEAPSLGAPLLVLRENTERPEAIAAGVARLVGGDPQKLASLLESNYVDSTWLDSVKEIENPFGRGDAARRIVTILAAQMEQMTATVK